MFLDVEDLLSENSSSLHAHLSNSLGSACKLTFPDIQNEILDSVFEVFIPQICLKSIILKVFLINYQ